MAARRSRRLLFGDAMVLVIGLVLLIATVIMIGGVDWHGVLSWVSRWGLAVALGVLGLAGVVDGLNRVLRPARRSIHRLPVRPIRAWVITAMIIIVAAATWGGVSWVLSTVDPNDPRVRVDAIRTGLAIGGGTAAAIALLLTARRQWLNERAQAHTEDDATERRVTELYTKAADQLGADKDPVVRLAALYSLERLAQANPEHRQTIVNVICAYLRMPYTPPPEKPAHPSRGLGLRPRRPSYQHTVVSKEPRVALAVRQQELQVRLTAQRILADHLRPELDKRNRPTNPKFWSNIDLDLTGATLIDIDFSGCDIGDAQFRNANFTGLADFRGARFGGDARFNEARFGGDSWFGGAGFGGVAWFGGARFGGDSWFGGARFSGDSWFSGARFSGDCWFSGARVRVDVPEWAGSREWPVGRIVRQPVSEEEGRLPDSDGVWGFLERVPDDDQDASAGSA